MSSDGDDSAISHVAVVSTIEPVFADGTWRVTVVSQFGAHGEYLHPIDEVPLLCGKPSEYWTHRRKL